MNSEHPLIEVIIPNWNGQEMLRHCLSSLQSQTFTDFSVTVVDNGSTDDSIGLMGKIFPQVKQIQLPENTGFSYAVNRGIEKSTGEWLLLLNNDMEVSPDCLKQLVAATKKYSGSDFFALKMLEYKRRQFVDGAGDAVLRGGVGYRIGTLEKDGPFFKRDRPTFGACGGAACYSREFFRKVGLFDEDFFAYLEDVDLNLRAKQQQLECMYISSSVVYHIGSATTGAKINPLTIKLSTRNNLYVLAKNYPPFLLFQFLPAILVFQLMWCFFCVKKRMFLPYISGLFSGFFRIGVFFKKQSILFAKIDNKTRKQYGELIKKSEKEAINSIMNRRIEAGKSNFLLHLYCKYFF